MPSWLPGSSCAQQLPVSCSQASCTQCAGMTKAARKRDTYTVLIEILGLAVCGEGLLILPTPRDAVMFDPTTWFTWKPIVEIIGMGAPVRTVEGKCASPGRGAEVQELASEGCWT